MDVVRTNKKKKRTPIYIAAGVIVAVAITVGLSQMEPAAPTVEDAAAWRDTVRRGDIPREVRGPGTLVPEQIRYIVAVTSGRVDQVFLLPGAKVSPGTPIMVMSNPDVQREALQAQQQLSNAQSQLISLKANLETQKLQQETQVAQAKSAYNTAVRDFKLQEELKAKNMSAANE